MCTAAAFGRPFCSFQFTEVEVHGRVEPFMKLHLLAGLSPTPDIAAHDFVARSKPSGWKWSEFFFRHQAGPKAFFGAPPFLPIPTCCDTRVTLSQLETSRPRGSERVAFIAFGNLRSFTRYGCLVLGKLDQFTAPVAGYRLHLFRKEISSVKFNHFRHNIIPSTRR